MKKSSEGSEVPEMLPCLLPHDSLVVLGLGFVLGRQHEAVVGAGNHLRLALNNLHQLQVLPRLLVVLGHRETSDLRHVGIADVLDGGPAADKGSRPRSGEGGDSSGEEEEGEEDEVVRSHGNRFVYAW